jgi:hypothetical protein
MFPSRLVAIVVLALLVFAALLLTGFGHNDVPFWSQWGSNAAHTGMVDVDGQPLNTKLADIIYDPFVGQEKTENEPEYGEGVLSAHYQSTLIDGDSFYMLQKTGTYIDCNPRGSWVYGGACGPNAWNWMIWNVARYDWTNGKPSQSWMFASDWKPEPNDTDFRSGSAGLVGWEPVFHPALANGYLYVPGASGTIWKVDKQTGTSVAQINPFASLSINPALTYVSSPLTASDDGSIYYNVLELSTDSDPWQQSDIAGAWLVRVLPDDTSATVTYATLTPDAPEGIAKLCPSTFSYVPSSQKLLPWPPSATSIPPKVRCGSQRPSVNLAPVVGSDGTIYTASAAHLDMMVSYLIAVNPDLSLKWSASMQHRLNDGCGVLLPIAPQGVTTMPNSCRYGTPVGIDPSTNQKGSGYLSDEASSSPVALPDGSVVMAVTDDYNYGRGHLMHFDSQGNYLGAYTFGWDSTPAVYQHDGTYSLVTKDNHYPGAAYCSFAGNPVCEPLPAGPYYLTQIDANMNVEWSFQNTTFDSTHPNGYEWCVNAPAIDRQGIVYVTSEDGSVYSLPQGHKGVFTTPQQKIFLLEAIGAAYTPLAIGEDGKEYSQNDGHLFVIGK